MTDEELIDSWKNKIHELHEQLWNDEIDSEEFTWELMLECGFHPLDADDMLEYAEEQALLPPEERQKMKFVNLEEN